MEPERDALLQAAIQRVDMEVYNAEWPRRFATERDRLRGLFSVPANVGITASTANPYVIIPHTYEQSHKDPFTHLVMLNTTMTSGVYGFNVSNGQILTSPLDLTMADASNVVNLFFNAGSFVLAEGSAAEYGIIADGEADHYWPTVDSFVSFTAAPEPASVAAGIVTTAMMMPRRRASSRRFYWATKGGLHSAWEAWFGA
jgi:hypothetical protein